MDPNLDAKQRYAELKKRLRQLIAENETYKQEIVRVNDRLLKVSKDKAFLLDQLLQFEDNDSSTESDLSDSDQDRKHPEPPKKKPRQRRPKGNQTTNATPAQLGNSWASTARGGKQNSGAGASNQSSPGSSHGPRSAKGNTSHKRKSRAADATTARTPRGDALSHTAAPQMANRSTLTSEELERHLQAKQGARIQMPQPTSLTLPAELFNEDAFLTDFAAEQIV